MKRVGIIIMAFSIFNLMGCGYVDNQQAGKIEKMLEEKYNSQFKATHIGGRYGTANNDTVTAYLHPINNESLVFSAVMTKKGELVSDNLIPRIVSNEINEILKDELEGFGVESETFTFVMKADSSSEINQEITLKEYVNKYKPDYFSAHMIVKESPGLTAETFEQAIKGIYNAGLSTTFQVNIRVISKEEYLTCVEEFLKLPSVTSTWFSDYSVVKEMMLYIDADGYKLLWTKE